MSEPTVRKVFFWRLVLGPLLIVLALMNFDTSHMQPDLVPSNPTQWFGYYAVTVAMLAGGVALVAFGIRRLRRGPPPS
jgi:hypothetical protein